MNSQPNKPVVCVMASVLPMRNGQFNGHGAAEKNIYSVVNHAQCTPLLLPALGEALDVAGLVPRVDGLVLTGGRANVEPHHYGGPPFPDDEIIDPGRDATAIAMVQACVAADIPVFGICRGIQEMNVALGGTLYYRIHLVPGFDDHRMPRREHVTREEIFRLRHTIKLTPGGLFEDIVGVSEVKTNTLHGQGIKDLADCLMVEAVSEDGVIEGVRLKNDPGFCVGVQWHAEYQPAEHPLSRGLFERFGEAAHRRAQRHRTSVLVHSSVA